MKKGISFYFGYKSNPKERAKAIKDAGFDCVITNADKRLSRQNGSIRQQMKWFQKYGLEVSSLHMQYTRKELPYFWLEGKKGEQLTKTLIKDIKTAHKYGFSCVVVHLDGKYSLIGENRLKKVLQYCEKYQVPLAIENIDNKDVFVKTFQHIDHPYLKFCYDSGHGNVFDKEYPYLSLYQDKLIALHLHDNDGKEDLHTLNEYGTINWQDIATLLKGKEIVLDYELLLRNQVPYTEKECLAIVKKQADALEQKIKKEKQTKKEKE